MVSGGVGAVVLTANGYDSCPGLGVGFREDWSTVSEVAAWAADKWWGFYVA